MPSECSKSEQDMFEPSNDRIYNAVVTLCIVLVFVTTAILGHAIAAYFTATGSDKGLAEYGPQGDFFGGHFGPVFGSLTLIVVIYSGYVQQRQQNRFFLQQQKKAEEALFLPELHSRH
ncbi:hypothetical protein [Azospirillum sp. INR13]|uniref:hypothetical protein n=1 Tax=Azospirillum sp. INR13 TaxID=2596919 RepID=UPI0019D6929D|nr:hypothetical protein [Azospirillum sp. INR13]